MTPPASAAEFANLPGRRQAFRITRERTVRRTGKQTTETTYGLTALTPARAGPADILALNRGHWEIENRLHYVRDVIFDEDRSRVRTGQLPRHLACRSNAAIAIVRLRARFQHQPEAHRHDAAKQGDALREVLTPLTLPRYQHTAAPSRQVSAREPPLRHPCPQSPPDTGTTVPANGLNLNPQISPIRWS